MSTQSVTFDVGHPNWGSRTFTATATDGQYTQTLDTLSSQALGLALPNQVIDHVQGFYTAGCGVWRIIDGRTLKIKRQGFMAKVQYGNVQECMISPYTIQPSDILECYVLPVDATANQSNVLGYVMGPSGIMEPFGAQDVVDSTNTALTSINTQQTLGDFLFGSVMTGFMIQEEDAGRVHSVSVFDSSNGEVIRIYGGFRLPTAGGTNGHYNLMFKTNIRIQKGWSLKVNVVTA